jgi:hypothetical protein
MQALRGRDSAVAIAIGYKLRAPGSGTHQASYPMGTGVGGISSEVKRPGVKLTTHLQLVPRSRKCGSIHPLALRLHGVVLN